MLEDLVRLFDENSVGLDDIEKKLELFIDHTGLAEPHSQAIYFKDFYMFFNL